MLGIFRVLNIEILNSIINKYNLNLWYPISKNKIQDMKIKLIKEQKIT